MARRSDDLDNAAHGSPSPSYESSSTASAPGERVTGANPAALTPAPTLHHQAASSSTLFNSTLGSPPVYQQPSSSSAGIPTTRVTASSTDKMYTPADQQQPASTSRVVHYQPHTQAPRIALTDPLADMRARNLPRPHGLGKNSDWPTASTQQQQQQYQQQQQQQQQQSRQNTFTSAASTASYDHRPTFSRQPSEMSLSNSELGHNAYGDNDDAGGQDPDNYAWSDEDDVEDAAKFEEEQAKQLRMGGGRGGISLWKIIRFLATTFLGNSIVSGILLVPVLVMQFFYRKHLPDYVVSDSPEANALRNHRDFVADNVQAAFVWAAFNLHMMWWLHIGCELFPRIILFVVRGIWGSASQRLLGLAEFYASCKQFVKPVFYAAMSWGSWAIIYGTHLYDLYDNSDTGASRASYTPRLFQVVEMIFFFILTVCAEKILIKFIAMKFHTSAYAERLAQVAQALAVFDVLRDYKPSAPAGLPQSSSRPGTPGASTFGLPKGFGGPAGGAGKSTSGISTPMRMEYTSSYNHKDAPMADLSGTTTSSADNTLSSKRKHADRRPPYFSVDAEDDDEADDEKDRSMGTSAGSKTLVDRKNKKYKKKAKDKAKGKAPTADVAGGLASLQNLFHPAPRRQGQATVDDPHTGIELDAQTGMPLRNRSHFIDGAEGTTPTGSGFRKAPTSSNGDSDEKKKRRRRKQVRRKALATAAQARAIARIAMNDPFGLLSSSQLLGGVGADVTGPAEAKRLARTIFKRFRGAHRRRYLVEADFEPAFEGREAARRAFGVFDRDGNGDISQMEIKNTVLATYKERRFLSRSVQDVHHAVSTLDKVILSVAMLIILFEALAIFNVNISKMVTTVYTLGLAFAFIFKQTASNVFDSIVFLFVTHAFDTGDRIMLGEQIMVVKRMSLLSTQFTLADGTDMYVSNALLGTLMIHNFRRSGYQWESVPLQFPFDTPLAKLDAVEDDMKHWLATEPERMFEPSTSIVPQKMEGMRSISCTVGMTHRANWQDWGARFARRNAFYAALSYYCKKHGVRYATSLQPVIYWEEDGHGLPPSYMDASGVDPLQKRVWVPEEVNDDFAPSPPGSPLPGPSSGAGVGGASGVQAPVGKPKCYMGFTPPPDEIEGSGLRMRRAKKAGKALAGQGGD